MAAFAQHEREAISQRTEAALIAARERGTRLGCPVPERGGNAALPVLKTKADRFAQRIMPVIADTHGRGTTSLSGTARELNARGYLTARGAQWNATSVRNASRIFYYYPMVDLPQSWRPSTRLPFLSIHQPIRLQFRIVWGGDWKTFKDDPHSELT